MYSTKVLAPAYMAQFLQIPAKNKNISVTLIRIEPL